MRLIDADALKEALELEYDDALGLCSDQVLAAIDLCIKLVNDAPTIEERP